MPLASQSDLALDIGDWHVQLAFEQAATWRASGVGDVPLEIQVTEAQLKRGRLPERLAGLMKAHQRPPKLLVLRISARALTTTNLEALAALKSLRDLGVRISLADFTSDKAALAILEVARLDSVVLSGKFLQDVPEDKARTALAKSLIDLAHGFKLAVTVKGVETETQLEFLTQHHVEALQGTVYCPAVSGDKLAEFVKSIVGAHRTAEAAGA